MLYLWYDAQSANVVGNYHIYYILRRFSKFIKVKHLNSRSIILDNRNQFPCVGHSLRLKSCLIWLTVALHSLRLSSCWEKVFPDCLSCQWVWWCKRWFETSELKLRVESSLVWMVAALWQLSSYGFPWAWSAELTL